MVDLHFFKLGIQHSARPHITFFVSILFVRGFKPMQPSIFTPHTHTHTHVLHLTDMPLEQLSPPSIMQSVLTYLLSHQSVAVMTL